MCQNPFLSLIRFLEYTRIYNTLQRFGELVLLPHKYTETHSKFGFWQRESSRD